MDTDPTVSVIIPTYNRAHLIPRAIQSVLSQTYRDFELIVVDDGSIDNTEEVVKSFDDERIRYIKHERNKGVASARNTGIKIAKGKYVAFLDSDDEWFPNKLEKHVQAFKDAPPKVGVVYSGVWVLWYNNRYRKTYISYPCKEKEGDLHHSFLKKNSIFPSAVLVKKECFSQAGMFDEELLAVEDWEQWLRISKYYHFKCIDAPLAWIHRTPGSLTEQVDTVINALQLISTKHRDDSAEVRRRSSVNLFDAGFFLCTNGQFARGVT